MAFLDDWKNKYKEVLSGAKQGLSNVMNRTDLDERATQFFRPETGTLATQGRQAYQNFARQPIPKPLQPVNQELGRFLTTKAPVASAMRGIGRGTLRDGTFGFTRTPQYTDPTRVEKAGEVVGGLVGSMASFGKIAAPLEGVGKAALGASNLRNAYLAKLAVPAVTREVGQSLAYLGGSKLGGEDVDFKSDLAFGLGMSALGGRGALKGFGKGMDQGRTPKIEWDPEDSAILDRLRGAIKNRKITDQELDAVDTWMTRLANGYMKNSEIERIANKWGGNRRKMLEEMGEVMFKRSKDAPQLRQSGYVDDFMMGIKGKKGAQPTKGDIKPQSTVGGVTKATDTLQLDKQLEIKQPSSTLERLTDEVPTKLKSGLQTNQITHKLTKQSQQTFEDIIAKGRKSIGKPSDPPNKNIRQVLDDTYTKWVDRYNPLSKAVKRVKTGLQKQGAELRPEYNPDYLVRRLTGAGGIADYKFKTELNPILKELETSNIPKVDMDTYLAHNRMLGFDQAGREVYGVNPQESKAVIEAMEQKYPGIKDIAGKFYDYQDRNLKELVEAGFFTAEDAASMRGQNPNYAPLYRVMDDIDEYLGLPTRKTMQGSSPVKKIKGSKRQILSPVESIIGDTFGHRAAIEKNRVAKSLVQMNQMVDLGFERVAKSGNDTITVWDNGQKQYWRVGQDIADVAKGVNEESMNLVLKIAQAPAQLLRQAATGRNPEFMFPNIIRDQLDAGITSKYGYLPFIDFVSGLKSMLANDDVYQSWQKSGAKIDLGELSGRKSVSKLFDEKTEKKGLFDWLSKGLDVAGVISEQPTRVGLYKKALKKTGNPLIAMMESRDATVDFARMGSKMKVANSIIPFLNVGVQGFDKLVRAGKDRPGKLLMNMGIYAAAPAATVTMYNLLNHPEEYAEIPQYEKDSNFIYDISRNENGTVDYKTIPKGNVVPFIANPIQSFLEYAAGSNPVSFKRMAMQTLSEGLPVLSGGGSLKEIATKTIGSNLPQAVKPITENLINKSFYKYDEKDEQAKEIVPYYLKDKPAYQQDYEFTPVMYKKIGAAFNVSPLQVKNLMEGYLAGYSKIPAQMVEMMTKYSRGEEISPNDKTLMRRFVKQTYPTSSSKAKEKEQPEVPGFMDRMTGKVSAAEDVGMALPENTKDLGVLYDDVTRVVDSYQENKIKAQYGLVDKTLEEYQTEVDQALSLKKRIEQERPEQILTLEVDQHVSGGGKTTEERAEWAYKKIYDIPQAKRADFVKRLLEEKVLTKSVVEAIKDQYGLLIPLYNEGGKVKRFSTGGGSKPKKLPDSVFKTVKLVRPRSSGSTPRVRVNRKRIPNRVTLKAKQVVKI